jgi:hypothetical protein
MISITPGAVVGGCNDIDHEPCQRFIGHRLFRA